MKFKIIVGLGSCGIAAGGAKVMESIKANMAKSDATIELAETGCMGMCYKEVLVEVVDEAGKRFLYGEVTPERVDKIFAEHIAKNEPVVEWIAKAEGMKTEDDSFFAKQKRIVLRNCGEMDPCSLDEAIARGAYKAIEKVLKEMKPEDVIACVLDSGIGGRGGAGFPTGLKWKFANASPGPKKYIICNADEGDPGAFMDRSVLEGDPHSVIEGMIIGGYAIGADEGYIYARAEYPIAIKRLKIAIAAAEEKGLLGDNILGLGFNFHLHIKEGAGAFVCGEETALIASIEGQRGMPRMRPPFPAAKGLFEKPTNINNVETFANIPYIINNGAAAYNSIGNEKAKGTKVFALAGKIARGGLVEVPMGTRLSDVINEIGGGTSSGKKFKAVQMGGPSGGCIPAELLETTIIDYASLNATGAIMGSGGMVVMDEDNCMVDIARFFLTFTQKESCGKCTFCKIGTKRMLEILTRITQGEGVEGDIERLEELCVQIKKNALCGLGQTAPNPVLTTLRYYRHEYEAHIRDKKCPAGQCKALIEYNITDKCVGCTMCSKVCPTKAIAGTVKQKHIIDNSLCIKCGACKATCKFKAIESK